MPAFATTFAIKQTVTYLDIVAAAVLMYDYILTVEREARLVWPVPWRTGKILFFLTRYLVFADIFMVLWHQFAVLDPETCDRLFKTIGFMLAIGTFIAETILVVRTWVIWERDTRIAITLGITLLLCWAAVFYFDQQALYSLVFTTAPSHDLPGCFLLKQKDILFAVFVIIMGFETIILGLTLVKGIEYFRRGNSNLVAVLYRDGILNYVYLFILSVINVVVLLTAPRGYTTLLTAFQRAMHSILSARILLHLREAAASRNGNTGLTSTRSVSLDFITKKPSRPSKGVLSTTGTTLSAGTVGATEERSYLAAKMEGDAGEAEIWFGDHAEGQLPETVTWFGQELEENVTEIIP